MAQAAASLQSTTSVRPSVESDDTHSSAGQDTNAQSALAYDRTFSSDANGCHGSEQSAPGGDGGNYSGTPNKTDIQRAAFDAFLARDAKTRRLMYGPEADLEDDYCLDDDEAMHDYLLGDDVILVSSPENMLDDELADNMSVDPADRITYQPCWMRRLDFDQYTEASPGECGLPCLIYA